LPTNKDLCSITWNLKILRLLLRQKLILISHKNHLKAHLRRRKTIISSKNKKKLTILRKSLRRQHNRLLLRKILNRQKMWFRPKIVDPNLMINKLHHKKKVNKDYHRMIRILHLQKQKRYPAIHTRVFKKWSLKKILNHRKYNKGQNNKKVSLSVRNPQ